MKKLLLSAAVVAISAGAALAADLPSRKGPPVLPPPPPPPPMWTGFYAGMNAGYNFGVNNNIQSATLAQDAVGLGGLNLFPPAGGLGGIYTVSVPTGLDLAQSGSFSNSQNGFVGGGQIGYNYQWGSNFVIGIEADIQGSGIRGRSQTVGLGGASTTSPALILGGVPIGPGANFFQNSTSTIGQTTVNAGVDWMGTVRGRLGYLVTPTMLVYGTGGFTYGGVYANVNQWGTTNLTTQLTVVGFPLPAVGTNATSVGGGSRSDVLVGWNAGGGIEWMFAPNWSLKAEGIYWSMGNLAVPTSSFSSAPITGVAGLIPPIAPIAPLANLSAFNGLSNVGATRVNYQGVIARMGVNYHFNWGSSAPVLAKY
jgi:outer membrane immunogenic protein